MAAYTSNAFHQGNLSLFFNSEWGDYYFVVEPGYMYYFNSLSDTMPVGRVDIQTATFGDQSFMGLANTFFVIPSGKDVDMSLWFQGNSSGDVQRWLLALERCCSSGRGLTSNSKEAKYGAGYGTGNADAIVTEAQALAAAGVGSAGSVSTGGGGTGWNVDRETEALVAWINETLSAKSKSITDFDRDLQDGTILCDLMSILSGKKIRYNQNTITTKDKLDNINLLRSKMEAAGIDTSGWGSQDVLAGSRRTIMRLIYSLVDHFGADCGIATENRLAKRSGRPTRSVRTTPIATSTLDSDPLATTSTHKPVALAKNTEAAAAHVDPRKYDTNPEYSGLVPRSQRETPDRSTKPRTAAELAAARSPAPRRQKESDPMVTWINSKLDGGMEVAYLNEDLRDGLVLLKLTEGIDDVPIRHADWAPTSGADKINNHRQVMKRLGELGVEWDGSVTTQALLSGHIEVVRAVIQEIMDLYEEKSLPSHMQRNLVKDTDGLSPEEQKMEQLRIILTRWIDSVIGLRDMMCPRTRDTFAHGWRNGVLLCTLLEVVVDCNLGANLECRSRRDREENMVKARNLLERIGINEVGWSIDDFLDENLKGQLMLLGKIAQRFKGWRPKDVLA